MKKIYLSGPMTGLPDLNFPAFHAEAARLRALGYDVINPAELPEGISREINNGPVTVKSRRRRIGRTLVEGFDDLTGRHRTAGWP
jgi:hypothetical protein